MKLFTAPKTTVPPLLDENYRHRDRSLEKLHALEKNISALLASAMDDDHKRLVLSVQYDYQTVLIYRIK